MPQLMRVPAMILAPLFQLCLAQALGRWEGFVASPLNRPAVTVHGVAILGLAFGLRPTVGAGPVATRQRGPSQGRPDHGRGGLKPLLVGERTETGVRGSIFSRGTGGIVRRAAPVGLIKARRGLNRFSRNRPQAEPGLAYAYVYMPMEARPHPENGKTGAPP